MHRGVPTMGLGRAFMEGLVMATWEVLMGTPNYGVMPGEKAKVSPCSGFYRQGFQLDDVCGVITPHTSSTRSSVITCLTSHTRQRLFASANWQSLVHSINSLHGREPYPRPLSGLVYERTGKSQCKKVTGHFTVTYGTDKVRSHGMVAAAIFLPSQLDCIITNGFIHTVWLWLPQWHHVKVSQPQPHRVNTFSLLRQKKSQTAAQCERT